MAAAEEGSKTKPLSFQETVVRLASHLEASEPASIAVACATLAVMLSQSTEQAALPGLAPKLLGVLSMDNVEVQRNAVAALSAAIELSDGALQEAVSSSAAQTLIERLQQQQGAAFDLGLTANLLTAVGTLCEGSPEGAQSVVAAGGVEALLAWCGQQAQQAQQAEQLQEAAVDALCKLCTQGEEVREKAADKGAIPALASLLCSTAGTEAKVRCLLALGMLVGGSPARGAALVAAPGLAGELVRLMRQGEDGDCQHIAAGIFQELANNPDAKEGLTAALKSGQA